MKPDAPSKSTRNLLIIGIGAGDPKQLTIEAIEAIASLDAVFVPEKGEEKSELRLRRLALCDRYAQPTCRRITIAMPRRRSDGDYEADVADWHEAIAAAYRAAFEASLRPGESGGLLVWGDPALYDSTLRIVGRLRAEGMSLETRVIPGISSVQLLAARHAIALHDIGEPVTIMPARRLAEALPDHLDSALIMLDGEERFLTIDDRDLDIFWGASLGLDDEVLASGPLASTKQEIARLRREARARKGWLMDSYLLRRRA